ncbi:MAG: polyprenyl synthetase family protein [bacterium]
MSKETINISKWNNFNKLFKDYVQDELKKILKNKKVIFYNELVEGVLYPLVNSGKFFRPYLLYQVVNFIISNSKSIKFDYDVDIFLPFALAIELVHNYSLVHDDLPAMDNATYRRGILTVHKKYGEAEAILIGDLLLTLAFQILSNSKYIKYFEFNKIIKIINEFTYYIGQDFLIIGQYLDIKYQKKLIQGTLENIKIINYYKTAGLILLSIKIPLILLNPEYSIKYSLIKYGFNLGYLFQYTDDYLDKDGIYNLLSQNEIRKLIEYHYSKALNSIKNFDNFKELKEILDFIYFRID